MIRLENRTLLSVNIGTVVEGIDYKGSNCGCLPPDTNAAVGNGFLAETVNVQFRVWDTSGKQLLNESLSTLFGQGTGGDPYVEYDAGAGRWYVTAIDGADNSKELLAISTDANPTHGFSHVYQVPLAASGDLADFAKFGYNADGIVIEAQDFLGNSFIQTVVTTVDKAAALSGTLTTYQSVPSAQFRALTPAQMHGASSGAPMWFMASAGDPTYDGTTPTTIRVTKMENILSSSPIYTDYSVSVNIYGPNSGAADQPGGPGSVATNDVTTSQVDYLNGSLVTAFSASTPADGFQTTKAHWYQVDVSGGTPSLIQEGVVDPGAGVATFFPTATQDAAGNIGITYMESSSSEFVSSYAAGHVAGQPLGTTVAGTAFAPGGGSMPQSFRAGDYSSVVLDPTDGTTFWAANEYIGSDGASDIWRTKIASFTLSPPPPQPSISISDVSLPEGNKGSTPFNFIVSLSAPSTQTITVHFATQDGTASSAKGKNNDYTATSGTLTFNPGQVTQTITVQVKGDKTPEPTETFYVNLSNPTNATIADGQGLGTILDDGAQPIRGGPAPAGTLAISLRSSNPVVNLTFGGQSDRSGGGLEEHIEALVWDQILPQKNRKSGTA
jgi:hypothetical protein